MHFVEAAHVRVNQMLPIAGFQVTVALRASGIGGFGKADIPGVLHMARTAMRQKGLPLIVQRGVVAAGQALSGTAARKLAVRTWHKLQLVDSTAWADDRGPSV